MAPQYFPHAVSGFIARKAACDPNEGAERRRVLACNKIGEDHARLLRRYRHHPKIVAALTGHWVRVVERLPVHTGN